MYLTKILGRVLYQLLRHTQCAEWILEYSCVIWHSSITMEERRNIERIQKTALRILLGECYEDYESALKTCGLDTLELRRTKLCLNFAQKCLKNKRTENIFPINKKTVNTRQHEKFYVTPAFTDRVANSAIPYLQRLLNQQYS